MLFKKWATTIADKLAGMAGQTDTYQIALIRYRLECLFSMILNTLLLVIVGAVLGILKTAFLIALTGAVVKTVSGGLHLNTPLRCAIIGALITAGFSYLAIYLPAYTLSPYLLLGILLLMNVIIWWKAPRESEGKPLSDQQKKYLAIISRILVFALSVCCFLWPKRWGVNELFYGLVFQTLSLLNFSARLMANIDVALAHIEKKPVL
ncbi:MAG: accessory gene regulator ArgB-like protein [Bacillota bacterium]